MTRAQNEEGNGKIIAVVAHCILNQYTVAYGLASHKGAVRDLVYELVSRSYGIIQLPCPEITFLGRRRWWMSKEQYDTAAFREHCRKILQPILLQLRELTLDGVSYILVGIKGSPSCGVFTTTVSPKWGGDPRVAVELESNEANAMGVFMEVLLESLRDYGIPLPARMLEIDHHEVKERGLPKHLVNTL